MAEELNNYFFSVFTRETRHEVLEADEEEIMTEMAALTITRDKKKKKKNKRAAERICTGP
jgi:hypothetical protein